MDNKVDFQPLLERLGYIFFVSNTVGLLIVIDIVFFKKLYMTIFLAVFTLCYYINLVFYRRYKHSHRGK